MKDKVVIITGGSSGIGKALAFEFGSHGSQILITGRNINDLNAVVSELNEKGIRAMGFQADVSQKSDNLEMAKAAINAFGKIDILINNAGISMRALFEDVDTEVIKTVMDINIMGAIYATKACIHEIIKTQGSIVGISSIAGFRGLPGRTGYSASKFALNGFLEVLRTEMLYKGVNVLTASPGFTSSNIRKRALTRDGSLQNESPRNEEAMMSAEECAARIYIAIVRRKKILVLTRQGKLTVLLNILFPTLIDKLVYKVMAKEGGIPK